VRGLMRSRTIIVATAHLTRDRARKSAARSAASCSWQPAHREQFSYEVYL